MSLAPICSHAAKSLTWLFCFMAAVIQRGLRIRSHFRLDARLVWSDSTGVRTASALSCAIMEFFVGNLSGMLITVRTARQGTEMVCGKWTPKYLKEISTVRLNSDDLAELGLEQSQPALLTSAHGQAIVTCRVGEGPRGLFFMPLGPAANQLFSATDTYGTGVPEWKGLPVTLSPYEEPRELQANRGEKDEHS